MDTVNDLGLDIEQERTITALLKQLLADMSVFFINTRGFHWNIHGESFFRLHEQFEDLYNDLHEKIDDVAERILALGETPPHTFTEYLNTAEIKETPNLTDAFGMVENVVFSLKKLLAIERKLMKTAGDSGDEGTATLISEYIVQHEKRIWMFTAFLRS